MEFNKTSYKGYDIYLRTDKKSHCVTILNAGCDIQNFNFDTDLVKMIVGDIMEDGSHNAIEKAKLYIDLQ